MFFSFVLSPRALVFPRASPSHQATGRGTQMTRTPLYSIIAKWPFQPHKRPFRTASGLFMSSDTQMTPRWHEKNIPSGALDHQANCIETLPQRSLRQWPRSPLKTGPIHWFKWPLFHFTLYKWLQIEARKNRLLSIYVYVYMYLGNSWSPKVIWDLQSSPCRFRGSVLRLHPVWSHGGHSRLWHPPNHQIPCLALYFHMVFLLDSISYHDILKYDSLIIIWCMDMYGISRYGDHWYDLHIFQDLVYRWFLWICLVFQ